MELEMCADHIDLILAKNRKASEILFETEHSIVILDKKMPCLFVSCTDFSEIQILKKCIEPYAGLTMAVHQKEFSDFFPDYDIYLECINLLYDKDELVRLESLYPIRLLNDKDVKQASLLYRKTDFNEYVSHCIKRNAVYGMFDNEMLIAMIGEHDEEIIGLLEVHPDYRRRHLAYVLENYMMHVQKNKGKPIASQIKAGNDASFKLHEKLGFEKGKEIVAWMRPRKRNV